MVSCLFLDLKQGVGEEWVLVADMIEVLCKMMEGEVVHKKIQR